MDSSRHISIVVMFASALCWALPARGQSPVRVAGEPITVVDEPGVHAVNASWSPTPTPLRIAYTTANYRGLRVKNVDDGSTRSLTEERAAGFGYKWSADGTAVLARVARYDDVRRIDAIKLFAVDSPEVFELVPFQERIRTLPEWSSDGYEVLTHRNGKPAIIPNPLKPAKTAGDADDSFASNGGSVFRVGANGSMQILAEFEEAVLNLAVSPDRGWLAFEVLGGDLYIMRADGTGLLSLGRGHRPAWSPSSRWVAFMTATDDGHVITSSELAIGST
ncbi:MAG: hypothetical protein R3282_05040, partial [Rhodothermales bacterium]|nr:hypothetical protein [Rhodothermales bacterium]